MGLSAGVGCTHGGVTVTGADPSRVLVRLGRGMPRVGLGGEAACVVSAARDAQGIVTAILHGYMDVAAKRGFKSIHMHVPPPQVPRAPLALLPRHVAALGPGAVHIRRASPGQGSLSARIAHAPAPWRHAAASVASARRCPRRLAGSRQCAYAAAMGGIAAPVLDRRACRRTRACRRCCCSRPRVAGDKEAYRHETWTVREGHPSRWPA